MVNNSDIKVSYRGNGQTINFPFSFPFFDPDYICVKILDETTGEVTTLESDYYVDATGSKVIYPGYEPGSEPPEEQRPPILPETSVLTIYRNTEVSQLLDLGEKFPLPIIENALDKITEILQEHAEEISRSVKVDITSTVTPDQLIEEIRNSTAAAIEAKITAVASAAAAEASKTNAATSASAAATSQQVAATSQQAAATSATNAAASAAAAAQSATNLETAVTTATTKAAEALASQQAAATSENNAAASATSAAQSATAAASSKTAAEAAEGRIADRWGLRKKSTQYPAKSIAYLTALPTGWYLECTTPGITDSGDITLPTPLVENATVTDGTVVWTIRKIGATDLSSCANTDLSNLSAAGEAKISNIPLTSDFKIIYPNGGTAANPANVAVNTRYVESNPFPGYYINCIAEVYYNNQWGDAGWFSFSSSNYLYGGGIAAHQLNDDVLIVQTSVSGVLYSPGIVSGAPFQNNDSGYVNNLPCRVKVWKVGKIPTA
jgi:hypothetical protein